MTCGRDGVPSPSAIRLQVVGRVAPRPPRFVSKGRAVSMKPPQFTPTVGARVPRARLKKGTSNEHSRHHARLFRALGRPDSRPHGHCRIERYDQNALPRQYAPSTAMRHCCWLVTHPPRGNGRGNFVALVCRWNARLRTPQTRMKPPRNCRVDRVVTADTLGATAPLGNSTAAEPPRRTRQMCVKPP